MNIALVIHGYPMRYNAGSEVYTQTLARGLARSHKVSVFTRQEDPLQRPFEVLQENDESDSRIRLHVINNPASRDRYRHEEIDAAFGSFLDVFEPDVVHIGHLNHLSTGIVLEAKKRRLPVLYTLHDFWLMCPRGQFLQRAGDDGGPWAACDDQQDRKCAERCYSLYFTGEPAVHETDVARWTAWVAERMRHVRSIVQQIDLFLAPSHYLGRRFSDAFGLPRSQVRYLDYGFDLAPLAGRVREREESFVFGYIGTHTPGKGIHHLLQAFGQVQGHVTLRIWGRPREPLTSSLRQLAADLPAPTRDRIEWCAEYQNCEIVRDVFNRVDAIVVPSIWPENSPLVIHEALEAGVPVITADAGGMAEQIRHEVNGLLYHFRSPTSLTAQMQRLSTEPGLAERLGKVGYLHSHDGHVPSLKAHLGEIEQVYNELVDQGSSAEIAKRPGPWRITFDTNPRDCNLSCLMCEQHSPLADRKSRSTETDNGRRRMDIRLIRRVLEESLGTPLREIIPSTMGEPLLYNEFEELIRLCAEFHVKMNLTTNGTFPRLGARRWAEKIIPIGSDVKISINGATPATQRRVMPGAELEQVLRNVRDFIDVRDAYGTPSCSVTLQVTFMECNVLALPDLIRVAAEMGVDRVKGHHLWVHFPELEKESVRRSSGAIERWNSVVEQVRIAADQHRRSDGRAVRLANFEPLTERADNSLPAQGDCPFLGQEAWIDVRGRFSPCCAPASLRESLGDFGTVYERNLYEVWRSEPYRDLCRNHLEHALCQTCLMRRPVEA